MDHAKAALTDTADDLVLAQLFDTSIAVDAQPVGLAWFTRHLSKYNEAEPNVVLDR